MGNGTDLPLLICSVIAWHVSQLCQTEAVWTSTYSSLQSCPNQHPIVKTPKSQVRELLFAGGDGLLNKDL